LSRNFTAPESGGTVLFHINHTTLSSAFENFRLKKREKSISPEQAAGKKRFWEHARPGFPPKL
jgi:hypothetical protein